MRDGGEDINRTIASWYAPRNSKAPPRWKFSHWRKTRTPDRASSGQLVMTGVSCATAPCRVRTAASTDARARQSCLRAAQPVEENTPIGEECNDAQPCCLGRGRRLEKKTEYWSGKRDLNPRPSPWQGDALPLSYSRAITVGQRSGILLMQERSCQAINPP